MANPPILEWVFNLLQGLSPPDPDTYRPPAGPTTVPQGPDVGALGQDIRGGLQGFFEGAQHPYPGSQGGVPTTQYGPDVGGGLTRFGSQIADWLRSAGSPQGVTQTTEPSYVPDSTYPRRPSLPIEPYQAVAQETHPDLDAMALIFFHKPFSQLTPAEREELKAITRQQFGLDGAGAGGPPYMAQLAEQQRQFDLTQGWLREQMAAQQAMEQQALAQRRREMGASIGQNVAGLQSQQWAQAMPYTVPQGTQYTPGYEPRGLMSQISKRIGTQFSPVPVAETPPPSREEMEQWVQDAISAFGGG